MGLDMYLYATKYVTDSKYFGTGEVFDKVVEAVDAHGMLPNDDVLSNSAIIKMKVAYWRKVNAVHGWFVDNCQDGEDDCRSAYVSREALQELLDICKEVTDDHSLAEELLPVAQGFFFGSYEYDDYYFGDIAETIDMLTSVLANTPDDWEFEYQSSW